MKPWKTVIICVNYRRNPWLPSCGARGSLEIAQALELEIKAHGIAAQVERIHCFGECEQGPNVRIMPGGAFFRHVRLEDVADILAILASSP
ncbi:MAG: (2Fe-2S) ferredoxin domain-containing protein [Pseudomonadota bacterium]|nr:(2Fe-2S) ferredoxin domain-containing protein [Pseudomonadota bacterium]